MGDDSEINRAPVTAKQLDDHVPAVIEVSETGGRTE
jgi:hypothetical protein